jgi:hypothetical protein
MALARVVEFKGVSEERIAQLREMIESGERPPDLPATEMMILHDPSTGGALAVVFFATEEDYAKGDAVLDAMPGGDTPGKRISVTRYEVAVRAAG